MKKLFITLTLMIVIMVAVTVPSFSQADMGHVVNVQSMKTKWPEKGTVAARDSLVAIYNTNVINKNTYILSHREYTHYFTGDNKDYLVVEEYADLAGMEAAFKMTTELENKAWPDEAKRKAFMDTMNAYFENWHGDALYHLNPKLSKN
jgi:hypothetical protein